MTDPGAALAAQFGGVPVSAPAATPAASAPPTGNDALARQFGGVPAGSPMETQPDFKQSDTSPNDLDPNRTGTLALRGLQPAGTHEISDNPSDHGSALLDMLGPLAHPQTLDDFARLLTMPVDSVRKALVTALTASAARQPVGSAISATGRGLEAVGNSKAATAAEKLGGAEAVFHLDPKGLAVAAAPTVLRTAGRVLQRAGAFVSGPAKTVMPSIGEAADAAGPAAAVAAEAPAAASATNSLPDQKLLNELAIEARRAGVKLTAAMEKTAIDQVAAGATPKQAVRAFAPLAPAEAAETATGSTWAPAKLKLTADEAKEAAKLLKDGKTEAEIREAIETARKFRERFGTPTPTAAQQRFPKGMRGAGGD